MSVKPSNQSGKKLYVYSGHQGGRYLFDRKLNQKEMEYNRFVYMGTLNEVLKIMPESIKMMAIRAAKARGR